MTIIAAITNDNGLGKNGDMLYHISADLKRFKELTMGHPLVMGRKTFESFPKGPLPGRRNMVITSNAQYAREGIETYPSLDAALSACGEAEPMILGGGQVYKQALPIADCLEITEVDALCPEADTHFPEINPDDWVTVQLSDWQLDPRTSVRFRYRTLRRR